jgi:hypothetical protein
VFFYKLLEHAALQRFKNLLTQGAKERLFNREISEIREPRKYSVEECGEEV